MVRHGRGHIVELLGDGLEGRAAVIAEAGKPPVLAPHVVMHENLAFTQRDMPMKCLLTSLLMMAIHSLCNS